jgi:putative PIN family toxin of toxin-antitoxin system
MRVLIDSNILFSAAFFHNGLPHKAYNKAVEPPHQGLVCEQSIEELRCAYNRRFPDKVHVFEQFVATMLAVVELVPVPPSRYPDEDKIRDIDDRPILRAAIKAGADIILTGDNDFLESTITNPRIMTARQFIDMEG